MDTSTTNAPMPQAIEDELASVRQLLRTHGFEPHNIPEGLVCELQLMGQHCATLYFVTAAVLQGSIRPHEFHGKFDLRGLYANLFSDGFYSATRVDQYLFVIATPQEQQAMAESGLLAAVETEQSYARKEVCTLEQLERRLAGLFPAQEGENRAFEKPTLTLLREVMDRPAEAPALTHMVTGGRIDTPAADFTPAQRELASAIYARIMGRGFCLIWGDDGAQLAQSHNPSGVPAAHGSRGEQAGLALALLLAKAAGEVRPGTTIGLHGNLHALDAFKLLAALDVLREFMAATGASIEIQTANTNVLGLAKMKFKQIAPASFR